MRVRITWIDICKYVRKEAEVAYVTFGRDMKAAGKEMGKIVQDGGKVIAKNRRDPFAMIYPLARQVALFLWCAMRMAGYTIRKVFG